MELKGSKTEQNLLQAFAGESQARNKYTYFAQQAREEGYDQIAEIFEETARNEMAHAKLWFKELGLENSTLDNLQSAIDGENVEWTTMYAQMANDAKEEGFMQIAYLMEQVAKIEKLHEDRFSCLKKHLEENTLLDKEEAVIWKCPICGYETQSESASGCPVCGAKREQMELKKENWK